MSQILSFFFLFLIIVVYIFFIASPEAEASTLLASFCGRIALKINGSWGKQARQAVKCEAAEGVQSHTADPGRPLDRLSRGTD